MSDSPKPTFSRPALGWFVVLDGGIAALSVLALHDGAYRAAREIGPLPEQKQLRTLLVGTIGLHVLEASLARRMASRRGLASEVVGRWRRQTFAVGFPSLLKLRKVPALASVS